jgi:hypothetical protein
VQSGDRHGQLFGQRAGEPAPDPDFDAELTDVLVAPPAATTDPAAQHGVAGDPAPDPAVVHPVTDLDDHAAPLVTEPDRELGMAVAQIRHLAGEELHVGATDTDPLDVDHHLARLGSRLRVEVRPAGRRWSWSSIC